MSEQGRHRRHQPTRLSRASLTVTAGGAGVALPLLAATGATAAPQESWSKQEECATSGTATACPGGREDVREAQTGRSDKAAEVKPVAGKEGAGERGSATSTVRPASYRVVSGDTLSGIAESQDVAGGWQDLYAGNRRTVGRDPDLILPGQRLVLTGEEVRRRAPGDASGPQSSPAKPTSKPRPAAKAAPTQHPERPAEAVGKTRQTPERKASTAPAADPAPAAGRKERRQQGDAGSRPADRARSADLTAPVAGFAPSTPYRSSGGSWSSGHHTGVDFPVATGTAVTSIARGRVVTAGWGGAYGYQVVIRHPDGKYSQYGHLSALSVRTGQSVNGGQRIGRSGSTGNSTGPHLHFEVRTGPEYGSDIDPLAYLRVHGVDI